MASTNIYFSSGRCNYFDHRCPGIINFSRCAQEPLPSPTSPRPFLPNYILLPSPSLPPPTYPLFLFPTPIHSPLPFFPTSHLLSLPPPHISYHLPPLPFLPISLTSYLLLSLPSFPTSHILHPSLFLLTSRLLLPRSPFSFLPSHAPPTTSRPARACLLLWQHV
ncbi:hypothetical protein E2C01_085048 [Portunus trituberculatus]|uniref:Uncharacterized protein n=1 Tax=Portunus trituberculatus TaxID=210409 RepID=A0A5B7IWX1_PORTR|nr:hypothetical protein [Portunus trituberculatus]